MAGQAQHVKDFIRLMRGPAQTVQAIYGIPASVVIAQSALETGWGRHVKGNAYFGVKGQAPSGDSITFGTHEVVGGKSVAVTDTFRKYDDPTQAAMDYGSFLRSNSRYAKAFEHTRDAYQFVDEIAKAGYATDPNYARSVKRIIKKYHLTMYDGVWLEGGPAETAYA
jgi:type VI secretion system secreted protein VgrG